MAYLGNAPARSFISFERQVFTIVNSQTAYTLDHSVNNENDIRLVVNNIVQEPGSGKAYTASGTTLTLSAALVNGTDEMYCVFLGRAVATNKPGAGSVGTTELAADAVTGAKIADDAISDEHLDPTAITGQTAETTIADDDLILISDTSASAALKKMTKSNFVSGVGGTNTPYFQAKRSTSQDVSDGSTTKIQFDSIVLDSASGWDSSDYKWTVPSGQAGKYFISVAVEADSSSDNAVCWGISKIFVNNSETDVTEVRTQVAKGNLVDKIHAITQVLKDLSVGDYVQGYGISYANGTPRFQGGTTRMTIFKLVE